MVTLVMLASGCGASADEQAALERVRRDSITAVLTDTAFARIARAKDWHTITSYWQSLEGRRAGAERFAEQYAERTAAVANFERVARQQAEEYLGEIELGFDPFDWAGEGEKAGNIRFIAEQLGTDTAILSRLERAQDKLAMQRLEHSLRIVENNLAEYRALPADSTKLRFEHASFVRFHLACAAENLRILGKKPEDLGLAPGEFEKLVVEFRPRSSEQCRELVMPRPRHSN